MNPATVDIKQIVEAEFSQPQIRFAGETIFLAPSSVSETVKAVGLALKHRFKICPSGTCTSLKCGNLPSDALVVASDKLTEVIEYAPDDLFIIVGAGMLLSDVAGHIEAPHLSLPFARCGYSGTVGGAIALGIEIEENGETESIRRSVTAVEFVTPYGKLINTGALTIKSVAGYDIARFLVGSKGCFGIITSVAFRLKSSPVDSAADVRFVERRSGIEPSWVRPSGNDKSPSDFLKENLDPSEIFPMP